MSSPSSSASGDVSSSSSSSSTQPEKLTKVPLWIPVSAFVGTSLVLALPLLMLRRGRITKRSLTGATAPPPRRAQAGSAIPPPSEAKAISPNDPVVTTLRTELETPSVGEMMTAFSHMNSSSAIVAAKAFGIATALVVASGAGIVWTVKTTMDVHNVRDFGQKMRYMMWKSMPTLTARILRPTEPEEHNTVSHIADTVAADTWTWQRAERRLQRAYEDGGVALWAQVALREMELEGMVERKKRAREYGEKDKNAVA